MIFWRGKNVRQNFAELRKCYSSIILRDKNVSLIFCETKLSVLFFAWQNYQSYFLREENGGLIFWVAKNVSLIFRVTKMSVLIFALENVILIFARQKSPTDFLCVTQCQSYCNFCIAKTLLHETICPSFG